MIIRTIPLGPVRANTYIVSDEKHDGTFIVDAGAYNPRLERLINDKKIEYILLTHGHFDHIMGVSELKKRFPDAKVCIHEADAPMLSDDMLSLAFAFGAGVDKDLKADIILHDGDELPFGDKLIRVIHTPGHTKGGVTYMIDDCMFTGDTLFCGSVGRTDFPGGDMNVLNDSICRLFDIDGDYNVYPGHDMNTTLSDERKNNPYVNWSKR